MKMPTLPKMPKMPRLPKLPKPQPKRLQATARRAAQPTLDDYDEEPTTRLSSAFVVVLVLHVVAVGGIYAFNSIKAHRRGGEPTSSAQVATSSKPVETSGAPAPAQTVTEVVEKGAKPQVNSSQPIATAIVPTTKIAPISGSRVYHVRSGDTLSKVAALHGVTTDDLQEANGLRSGTDIRVGQTLNIPAASAKPAPSPKPAALEQKKTEVVSKKVEPPAKASPAANAASAKTYIVKKGDNPVAIAKKFSVPYDELLRLNKIEDPKKLRVDQVLKIPAKKNN